MASKLHSFGGVEFEVHTTFERTGFYSSCRCPLCQFKVACSSVNDSTEKTIEVTVQKLTTHLLKDHAGQIQQ